MAEAATGVLDRSAAVLAQGSSRLTYVDALRGSAAVSVMLFHLSGHRVAQEIWSSLPSAVGQLLRYGELGVQVFFVISGFVIAHSVRNTRFDRHALREFMTRRAIRLEPPYLVAIVAVLLTNELSRWGFGVADVPRATVGQVVAHVFYVQRLVGYDDLYPVFWTLSHEVQFYLLFVIAVVLGQAATRGEATCPSVVPPRSDGTLLGMTVGWIGCAFGATAILSGTGALQANGLCLDTWYLFSLGVLSYGVVCARVPWQLWLAVVLGIAIFNWDPEQVEPAQKAAGIATAASLVWVGRWNGLHTLGSWRPLQFLAAISYSLYLIHGIVGWRVMSVGQRVTGTGLTWATLWFVVALASAVLAAWLLHVWIERPAIRWLARTKPKDLVAVNATGNEKGPNQ